MKRKLFITSTFAFLALNVYSGNLWVIGEATPYGWNLDDASALVSLPSNEGIYTGTLYLKANEDFKFMTQTEWGNEEYGIRSGSGISSGKVELASGYNDKGYDKLRVTETGNYAISVDTKSMTASIEKSPYQDTNISFCSLFLVGDATQGGWSVDAGTPLSQNPPTPYIYAAEVKLKIGNFKIATAVRGAGTFDPGYFYFADPSDSNRMILNHDKDTQWSVSTPGIYTVTVNIIDNRISIVYTAEWTDSENSDFPQLNSAIHKYKAPLYWSVYEYCFELEKAGVPSEKMDITSQEWDKIIDWVAQDLLPYGYDMICTDGFIPMHANDATGYMTHYGSVSLKDLVAKCKAKGLRLGVYDNPLWIHGAPEIKVAGTNYTLGSLTYKPSNSVIKEDADDTWFTWAVAENPGTREFIDGFFKHYHDLGVEFIRMDFLSWYEDGTDRGMGTVGKGYGHDSYELAMRYIAESAEKYGIFTSLVMPHMYDDAKVESAYGHMTRIVADTGDGGWGQCSRTDEGKAYSTWPNCMNMFDGFTYWSHISGRNKIILDGDFIRLNKFSNEAERQTVISLQLMAGGPIAVADQYNTIGENLKYYTNAEILELNEDRFVGQPLSDRLGDSDNQVWYGSLNSGDYVVALFNRSDSPRFYSYVLNDFGITGEFKARDLWTHSDEEITDGIKATVPPHGCKVIRLINLNPEEDSDSGDIEDEVPSIPDDTKPSDKNEEIEDKADKDDSVEAGEKEDNDEKAEDTEPEKPAHDNPVPPKDDEIETPNPGEGYEHPDVSEKDDDTSGGDDEEGKPELTDPDAPGNKDQVEDKGPGNETPESSDQDNLEEPEESEGSGNNEEEKDSNSIYTLENKSEDAVEFFTLSGIKVKNPVAGIYIQKRGKEITKIVIR